jgi:imidazoleglycerol phosphate synthase glutamine amidotransferase subunit HisH
LYFAHSYELKPNFRDTEMATSKYGNSEFLAALRKENTWGSQFHPEKSHEAGLRFLEGFLGAHS